MRIALVAAAAAAALLAGCSDGIDLTNASIDEVARVSAAIDKPQPGQWTTDARLTRFDAGPERSAMADALKAQVGQTVTTEACLSKEEADRPLFGDLVPAASARCTFRRFRFRDGRLDAAMACRNADGATLEVRQAGSYSASAVDLDASVTRTGADGRAQGGMTTKLMARRTGACAGEGR